MIKMVKEALEAARHELTTLHNLTVTDNVESCETWVTDTTQVMQLIDAALHELQVGEEQLIQGAEFAMHVSANIGNVAGVEDAKTMAMDGYNLTMQKAIRDAAKVLNIANNARFINIVEWRTEMIERLLSSPCIKTIDEAIAECQKIETHVFCSLEPNTPKDWRL